MLLHLRLDETIRRIPRPPWFSAVMSGGIPYVFSFASLPRITSRIFLFGEPLAITLNARSSESALWGGKTIKALAGEDTPLILRSEAVRPD